MVTSDYEEAVQVADRVVVMQRGRSAAELTGADVTAQNLTSSRRLDVSETVTPTGAPGRSPMAAGSRVRRRLPETAALAGVLIVLAIFFTTQSRYFLTPDNFINILTNAAVIGIIAAPATLLLVGRPVRPVGRLRRRVHRGHDGVGDAPVRHPGGG